MLLFRKPSLWGCYNLRHVTRQDMLLLATIEYVSSHFYHIFLVFQNYQNVMDIISNMSSDAVYGGSLKFPRTIHMNIQSPHSPPNPQIFPEIEVKPVPSKYVPCTTDFQTFRHLYYLLCNLNDF